MIEEYAKDLALEMGIKLAKVSLVDGERLGCIDVHLLKLSTKENHVETLVYQVDLEILKKGIGCDRLDVRTRSALSRLQMLES
jgi:hypothetical protein